MSKKLTIPELEDKANKIREVVIKMLINAGSGHSAGPLGSADFWTALYFGGAIEYKPDEPWWEGRDKVVVSAGHYAPVVYAILAEAGFFPVEELDTLRKLGTRLQGHPYGGGRIDDKKRLPGIETSSGSLGQGISQAIGMALVDRLDGKKRRIICFLSDGEQDEGQVWEGYMLASKNRLHNLTMVVDRNNIQIEGYTEEVMPLESFRLKLEAFGLYVLEVDGHNMEEIIDALNRAKAILEKPTIVVLHTIPGKGVDYMEGLPKWHGRPLKVGEAVEALSQIHEIRTLGGKIISEHE